LSDLSNNLSPLVAQDLAKSYAGAVVLDGVDLVASPGQRVGLVGENGSGKSTLLRLLAGAEPPDRGTVRAPDDLAYLPQEPRYPRGTTVGAVLDEALAALHQVVDDVETLGARLSAEPELAERFAQRLEWAQAHDAWDADRRAALAADRLGLDFLDRSHDVARLSGGQRSRLALAALVVARPGAVLLDEPTNHLDDEALEVLEEACLDLPGVVVVVSHDRVFLDRVCTAIVDLDPSHFGLDGSGGNRYRGSFSDYLRARAEARARWERTYADEQEQIAVLRRQAATTARQVAHNRPARDPDKFVYAFKGGKVASTVARRVRDVERRLEVAERDQVRKPPRPLRFDETLTATASRASAVQVRDLIVRGRLEVPRLDLAAGGKLLVEGANGSGKSTLLHVLAGNLRPDEGSVHVSARRIGLLVQDVAFRDPTSTAVRTYEQALGPDTAERRPLSGLGLLHPREAMKPVANLSVGQRRRLALAILVGRSPDLLLLDEPTNHISLALAGELEEALSAAPGTVLVASHDRWLRRGWQHETLDLTRRER
jgi:macrolide transport system ATP-binding/permease protein